MSKKFKSGLLLTFGLLLAVAFSANAAVPAPPVNQFLGIDDGVFNNISEPQCRLCHGPNAELDSPVSPDPTNVNRHHLRVDTIIGDDPTQTPSAAPCLQDPASCNVGDVFECFSCHELEFNPDTGAFEFATFRDCLQCHQQIAGQASVHHRTPTAEARNCVACHGNLVQNFDDGHRIPTYEPSLVTPWPSGKPNGGDPSPVLPSIRQGNCNYCHNTATGTNTPTCEDKDRDGVLECGIEGNFDDVLVYQSDETHHSTGFILDGAKCVWCHNVTPGVNSAASMRRCEECHGIDSLHNIQFDNAGDGIDPGTEDPWYGHIGNNSDCEGCHGFTAAVASTQAPSSSLIPNLTSVSRTLFTAGVAQDVELVGVNFVNEATINGTLYNFESDVVLTDATGYSRTLEPTSVTDNSIQVTIPADIPVGSYRLAALKAGKKSNPIGIAVKKQLEVYAAECTQGTLTISGSGFSQHAYGNNSGTSVTSGAMVASINSWADDQIVSKFSTACPDTVDVNTVNGSMTASVQSDDPTVSTPTPVLDRFNRKSGKVNSRRYLMGSNFGDGSGDLKVLFDGVEARIGFVTDTRIKFYVPKISSGNKTVTVVRDGQTSEEALRFRVR